MHFPATCQASADHCYAGLFRPSPLKCQQNHYFRFTALSRSFVETTIKANRIGPYNRDWGALARKCIKNRTRGRSRKGAELIVYCFKRRHLWGSKFHAGHSIPLRFYFDWSVVRRRCQKLRVRSYYNGYMTDGGGFLGGAWEWFRRSYIIVMPCLWSAVQTD